MKKPITNLSIENFKTLKKVSLECKRINLIIGKPNVGKSNFLEALSLLGINYGIEKEEIRKDFIRYKKLEDLFYDKETTNPIKIQTNIGSAILKNHYYNNNCYLYLSNDKKKINLFLKPYLTDRDIESTFKSDENESLFGDIITGWLEKFSSEGQVTKFSSSYWDSPVKKYFFTKNIQYHNRFHLFLNPPDGDNLYAIVNRNKKYFAEIANLFKDYKLSFVMKSKEPTFELQKKIKGVIYSYDYDFTADTLQRMIFYLMAIISNKESILLFEEPETHSFPYYTKMFAEKVIEAENNQFFISTHSPFILNTIIENAPLKDVAVFLTTYDKFQTNITALTEKELSDMQNYGNDIFFSNKIMG